jgi:hypothetical protein
VSYHIILLSALLRLVRLAYQQPISSTFLSEQTSHQQPASSTFSLRTNQHQQSATSQTNRLSAWNDKAECLERQDAKGNQTIDSPTIDTLAYQKRKIRFFRLFIMSLEHPYMSPYE